MRFHRGQFCRYVTALAVVAALGITPALAGPSREAPPAALASVHIDNFGKVDDHYYRGAQPKPDDIRALSGLGVKLIIDLAKEGDMAEDAEVRAAGLRFVRIPMTTHDAPTPAVIAQFLSLVSDPANEPVYVHCIGGRHRTGVMTAIYRMTVDGWNAAKALDEMKHYKFGPAFLHPEFREFVERFVPAQFTATR